MKKPEFSLQFDSLSNSCLKFCFSKTKTNETEKKKLKKPQNWIRNKHSKCEFDTLYQIVKKFYFLH